MINAARKNYEQANLVFTATDFQTEFVLPYHSIDLVFSTATLSATQDKEVLLARLHRCLQAHGYMVLKAAAEVTADHPMKATFNTLAAQPQWQSFAKRYRAARQMYPLSLQDAMKISDPGKWEDIRLEPNKVRYVFRSKDALAAFLLKGMENITSLEQEEKEAFVAEFVEEYVKLDDTKVENDDELILYEVPSLTLKAQKRWF
jgi:trans-aconitate methyltransferase